METSRTIQDYVLTAIQCVPGISRLSGDRYKLPLLTEEQVYMMLKQSYLEVVDAMGCELKDLPEVPLAAVARWFVDKGSRVGIILMGGVGNGKTTMALAIARTYERVRVLAANIDREQETREQHDWAMALSRIPETVFVKAMAARSNPPEDILIVDDFGEEPVTVKEYGTDISPMREVISQRYDSRKPIVLTTNLDTAGIQQRYGTRIADRLKETCEVVAFRGVSYR